MAVAGLDAVPPRIEPAKGAQARLLLQPGSMGASLLLGPLGYSAALEETGSNATAMILGHKTQVVTTRSKSIAAGNSSNKGLSWNNCKWLISNEFEEAKEIDFFGPFVCPLDYVGFLDPLGRSVEEEFDGWIAFFVQKKAGAQ